MKLVLPSAWSKELLPETKKPYYLELKRALLLGYKQRVLFPAQAEIFTALALTAPADVKVVIIGQDPYHGADQAHGLAFSVQEGQKIPPSLRNIYKEIATDTGNDISESGYLKRWAQQGVLLLNTTLTVEAGEAGSHQGWGWEIFTDEIIRSVSSAQPHVVFLLWGKHAQGKEYLINTDKHLTLKAPHPSPLSAHRGFFGCKHFSKTNDFLIGHKMKPIDW